MNCEESLKLMHQYLDGDASEEEAQLLREHLHECPECQQHYQELKQTESLLSGAAYELSAPAGFTASVMAKLPKEKKRVGYMRWFRTHPVITAAAVFFLFMFTSVFSAWNNDASVSVSKQEGLIVENDLVIVPEGVTVEGDLVVENGDLDIRGEVDGDVTILNGDLVEGAGAKANMAAADNITGEYQEIDRMFGWLWFHMKQVFTF
ncbi:zf-HC2 domain-containing protein [Terribacillus halophilus]|jgi:anti-sigma factor RsiW|uniref:zf-HC2 domain-containing protein n=1 Tax=Terribacillus halophilus TaxID=361279 RepID=UPI000987CF66|nr:zf-HC2 domain-containing protein [Terribacillus halophilus]